MFDGIRGIMKGNKVAKTSGALCQDCINFLIMNLIDIKLPDTAYVLGECYCLTSFATLNPDSSQFYKGAAIVQAHDVLKDWLVRIFRDSSAEHDFDVPVKEFISTLESRFTLWVDELRSNHPEMGYENIHDWIPFAVSQYVVHVAEYLHGKYENIPTNLNTFLVASAANKIGNK